MRQFSLFLAIVSVMAVACVVLWTHAKVSYERQLQARLNVLETRLDELKDRAAHVDPETTAEVGQLIDQVDQRAGAAKDEFDRIKRATLEEWQEVQMRAETALSQYEQAVRHAETQIGLSIPARPEQHA